MKTVNFRLTSIEKTLASLKDILTKVALQDEKLSSTQKEVSEIKTDVSELKDNVNRYVEGQNGKYVIVEENVHKFVANEEAAISKRFDSIEKRVATLETRPLREKADRWQYIVDYIFKGLVAVAVGALLVMVKLKS